MSCLRWSSLTSMSVVLSRHLHVTSMEIALGLWGGVQQAASFSPLAAEFSRCSRQSTREDRRLSDAIKLRRAKARFCLRDCAPRSISDQDCKSCPESHFPLV